MGLGLSFLCQICFDFIDGVILASAQLARKFKKSRPKKIVKSNKSISMLCNFGNGQNSIFWTGKSLKLPKMEFSQGETAPSMKSKQIWHKKDKPCPNWRKRHSNQDSSFLLLSYMIPEAFISSNIGPFFICSALIECFHETNGTRDVNLATLLLCARHAKMAHRTNWITRSKNTGVCMEKNTYYVL